VKTIDYLSSLSKLSLLAIGLLFNLLIALLDYMTGSHVSVSLFYLIPICFVTWFINEEAGSFMSVVSITTITLLLYLQHDPITTITEAWNIALVLGFFGIVTFLLSRLKDHIAVSKRLADNLQERSTALIAKIDENKLAEERILTYQKDLRILMQRLSLLEEQKRKEISEELHDNIGQTLALSKIKLTSLQQSTSCVEIAGELEEIKELIEQSIQFTRSLYFEISSPILHKLGLIAAIKWLCEHFRDKYGIMIEFTHDNISGQLAGDISVLLFKTVQELLINVVKHANTSMARVSVTRGGNKLRIEVKDEGVGFDSSNRYYSGNGGLGLFIIKERINFLRGTFDIASEPKCGTRCNIVVPL
jgi:signal transduction histidine kinase